MNGNWKRKLLPLLAVTLGAVTAVLRYVLYAVALDEKNLLLSGHILSILVWAVVAVAAIVIFFGVASEGRGSWIDDSTQPSLRGALGALLLSAAIGFTVYVQGMPFTTMEKLSSVVGLLSVLAVLWAGVCRLKGKRPFFLCHGLVCVYFALYLVSSYGSWSANPQLQDYVFTMLSCGALALFAYQQAALDVEMGSGKLQYALGLAAGYLGIAALYGSDHPWLYLAGGLWALTNLSRPAAATWYRYAKEEL